MTHPSQLTPEQMVDIQKQVCFYGTVIHDSQGLEPRRTVGWVFPLQHAVFVFGDVSTPWVDQQRFMIPEDRILWIEFDGDS